MATLTNRQAFRQMGEPICEYEPVMERDATLDDRFHGVAVYEVNQKEPRIRLCDKCAELHRFKDRERRLILPFHWSPLTSPKGEAHA